MRQRLHVRGVDRHHRVEQVREVDAVGLGGELEVLAGGIEGPGAAGLGQGQLGLVGAEQHLLQQLAVGGLVVDGEGVIADRLGGDDAHDVPRLQARDGGVLLDVFEFEQVNLPAPSA